MKAAQFAAAIAGAMHPVNTDLGLVKPDHAARAKAQLEATVALLEAAIPDPFQRLAIINAIIDYGTERALGAINNITERWRQSIDRRTA